MPQIFLLQLISSVGGKIFEDYSKMYLEYTKINVLKQLVKIILLFFANCSECSTFGKSDKDKSFGDQPKPTNYLICFLLSCVTVKNSYENCKK